MVIEFSYVYLWHKSFLNPCILSTVNIRCMASSFVTEKPIYNTPDNDLIVLEKCNFVLDKSLKSPGISFWKKCGNLVSVHFKLTITCRNVLCFATAVDHDDVIKWKYFPRYWPFVRGIHRSPVTRSFDVFFDLRLNKRLSKQS